MSAGYSKSVNMKLVKSNPVHEICNRVKTTAKYIANNYTLKFSYIIKDRKLFTGIPF
jgi:hypothetical protein